MGNNEYSVSSEIAVPDVREPGNDRGRRRFQVQVDETRLTFEEPFVTGLQLMERVGKASCRYALVQVIRNADDQFINPDERVDLSQPGVEKFITALKDMVTITVDGNPIEVRRGLVPVVDIKRLAGIADAYRLTQDINGELRDVTASEFQVEGCEVFESRPQAGGAS